MKILFFLLFATLIYGRDIKLIRAQEFVKEGFWSYQRGDFKEAISCYKKVLEIKPDFSDAWYWYGNSLFRYGMNDLAKESYKMYLRLSDDPYTKDKIERYWEKGKDEYVQIFTIKGDIQDDKRFFSASGIYVDKADNLYVAGFGNDVLLKLSPFGRLLLRITHKSLKKPYGVCTDNEGNVYATSYSNNCLLKFSPSGKLLLKFGKKGRGDGEFIGCKGISIDSFGYIYVVDAERMQKFSKEGKFISKIDGLCLPNNLVISQDGSIFISDSLNVKIFDSSGNLINSIPIKPKWVSIHNNNIYIVTKDGISIYSKEGKTIKKIKTDFAGEGLALNKFGFIYISSPGSSNIYTFSSLSNLPDILVNRIDLANYPMVLFSITLKKGKYDIPGLFDNNFKVSEENRVAYPLGVDEILKKQENLGLIFVIEDSKYIKKDVKNLLLSSVSKFKDGFAGASIISFSNTSNIFLDFTLNKTQIKDAIEKLSFNGSTNEDALLSSLNKGIDCAVPLLSKRAVIVITSISLKKETQEIKRLKNYAKNNGIPIFVIDYKKDIDPILEKIAKESYGKYLLSRNSKELNNFYNFLTESLSCQVQYILYYHSPNASLKWSNEWIEAILEVGQGKFGLKEKISYLIPDFGGANSSLGRALIEKKLYLEQAKKIEEYKKKKEEERKKIKEMFAAEHKPAEEKKEEKKEEKEEEKEEAPEEEKEEGGHGGH
ncbi:MAG: tetratricopeptide repeat protein [bacterium]